MYFRRLLFLLLILPAAAACSTIQQERSIGRELDDANASISIKSAMMRVEGYAMEGVDVEVTEGVALLTGTAPREEDRRMAECIAWRSVAVRSVANEINVAPSPGLRDRSRDALISQSVRGRLLRDREIRSVNYNVETYAGTVYLLGVARSRAELDRSTAHASLVDGVDRVVSYVRVANEPSDLPMRGAEREAACAEFNAPAPEAG